MICDRCESTKDVSPIKDPWGGTHGWICADCESSQEDDYYGATCLAADNQVRMDKARELK